MSPAPVPLPLTWQIYCSLKCPSCGSEWNFARSYPAGTEKREMYCPNPQCPQHDHRYTVKLNPFVCEICEVVR